MSSDSEEELRPEHVRTLETIFGRNKGKQTATQDDIDPFLYSNAYQTEPQRPEQPYVRTVTSPYFSLMHQPHRRIYWKLAILEMMKVMILYSQSLVQPFLPIMSGLNLNVNQQAGPRTLSRTTLVIFLFIVPVFRLAPKEKLWVSLAIQTTAARHS